MIISLIAVIGIGLPAVGNIVGIILRLLFSNVFSGILGSWGLDTLVMEGFVATMSPMTVLWVMNTIMSRLVIPQYRKIYEYGKKGKDGKKVSRGGKIRTKGSIDMNA